MTTTTVNANNKLVRYTQQINREVIRQNRFSPYMGTSLTSIIRLRNELKAGGEQMNIPMVTKLTGAGKGVGTLVGAEEAIDNYGMRVWLDWCRHAVETNKAQRHKDSADIFGEAKSLLSEWAIELQRDELIEALMALPSESTPANFGGDAGDRVNGIRYEAATATQRNTWNADNSDRVLYGKLVGNYNATHATALANVDGTDDKLSTTIVSLAKRIAMTAAPKIKPYKTEDETGREYYVMFAGTNAFRDLKASLETVNKDARERAVGSNPIFQAGDEIYDGVIIREVPEISQYVTDVWTTLKTAGNGSSRVEPVFLCGQQAASVAWGQMARPTFKKEDDYGFVEGAGIEMAYGIAKNFKKHSSTKLVQWGVVTGFVSAAVDA